MKKIAFFLFASLLLCTACKKKIDDQAFSGTIVDGRECTGMSGSINDMDWGWVVALDKPTGVGVDYVNTEGQSYHNVVILYGTKTRLSGHIKGRLYMDDDYSASYCAIKYNDLPQAVCSKLE